MATRKVARSVLFPAPRALLLLAHPVVLACAALLSANELIFSRLWPSWLTGKLGDFAWLGLAPLLAAAALALLLPPRLRGDAVERRLFWTALALTGLGFTLVKTLPSANIFAERVFGFILNAAPSITLDPTDLIALPALLLPAWLYKRERQQSCPAPQLPARSTPRRLVTALVALPLISLALLADAPAPNTGFTCLEVAENTVTAAAGYQTFISQDGGLTWTYDSSAPSLNCSTTVREGDWTIADGPTTDRRYRYQPGKEIQLSTDGGQTWQPGITLTTASEPEYYYLIKTHAGNPVYQPGPMDAAGDPRSGNMLFAMGYEGVLVHTADNRWVWSYGGAYRRIESFPDAASFSALLGGEIYLALVLALLVYASGALRRTLHWLRVIVVGLAWLAWLAVDLIFPPATATSYATLFTLVGILAAAVLALSLVIEQTVRLTRRAPRVIWPLAALALGGALTFFLPYVLWMYGVLPTFNIATIAGLVAAGAFTAAAILVAGRN